MRLKALLLTAIAGIIMFAGCAQEDHQDIPYLDLSGLPSDAVLNFSADASSQTFTIVTNRPWHVDIDDIWINVEPASGPASTQPQEIRVTVLSNEYFNRTASVKVSLDYDYRTITVNQVGGWGDPEDMVIYKNNFDKEAATQSYGTSGTSWPYTDQSDCWKNEEGTGIENIAYTVSGISVRNNSNSNGNYSDYEGSGTNNLFFGTRGGFKVANLNVEGKGQDFQLTFGSEKY
ncbi:MAG: BACON domain-containing protein, partial [Bacteroidales bacterium]|nr:BACON domain-containing protein [Bacteroidales bacterium]